MKKHFCFAHFLAAFLIAAQAAWGLPPLSADTLRGPQEAETRRSGLEESLTASISAAGLEEDFRVFQQRLIDRLEELQSRLRAARTKPFVWDYDYNLPMEKQFGAVSNLPGDRIVWGLLYVMAMLLDRPSPSIDEELRTTLEAVDREILKPILQTTDSDWSPTQFGSLWRMVQALPSAEEHLFLALSMSYHDTAQFGKHHVALAAYSPRASALAFGRCGPHQRTHGLLYIDDDDVQTAPALLRGFISHLDRLLVQVEQARGQGRSDTQAEREARDYIGSLWNGLMVGVGEGAIAEYQRQYYVPLAQEANGQGVDFPLLLIRCAELFPGFLPEDRVPEFLVHNNDEGFAFVEIDGDLGPYNRTSGLPPLTLWDVTVGRDEAKAYLQEISMEWGKESDKQYLEQIYYFLRGVDPPDSASAAGLEEEELERVVADPMVRAALVSQGFAAVPSGYIAEVALVPAGRPLVLQVGLEEPLGLSAEVPVIRAGETTVVGMLRFLGEWADRGGYNVVFSAEYFDLKDAQAAVPLSRPMPGSVLLPKGVRATAKELGAAFVISQRTGTVYIVSITEFTSPDWEKPLVYIRTQA